MTIERITVTTVTYEYDAEGRPIKTITTSKYTEEEV